MDNPIAVYKKILQFIEENIHDIITLEMLEDKSSLSRFQLTRLFIKLCGYSPIDYVKRRKLSKSIPELYSKKRILDIAMDYGFEYEQSYIRAFRSVYGFSPAKLRKKEQAVTLLEPPELNDMQIYAEGFLTSPKMKYLSNIQFIGEEKYYNYKDNNIYGFPLLDGLAKHSRGVFTGVCIPCDSGNFTHRYISCHDSLEQNRATYSLPNNKYAVFNYTGFHGSDKNDIYKLRILMYIVINSWMSQNHYIWKEYFIEQVNVDLLSKDYFEIDIIVPLNQVL